MYVYCLNPIDYWNGWHLASDIVCMDMNVDWVCEGTRIDPEIFFTKLRVAKVGARKLGWEGDISCGPYISALPVDDPGSPCPIMIAWKQSNNGTTFVASPYELPWLNGKYTEHVEVFSTDY